MTSDIDQTITIHLNQTCAELLASLCVELNTDDAVGVVSQALGLLDLVQKTKRHGGRLCFVNDQGHTSDVMA